MLGSLVHAKYKHGLNGDDEKLVHLELSGVVGEPYPESFVCHATGVGWRDRLTMDPFVDHPAKIRRFLKSGLVHVCVRGFEGGYASLLVENGVQIKAEWVPRAV